MTSIKESLRNTIDQLNEEEAQQVLDFVQRLRKQTGVSPTLRRLISDPSFHIPKSRLGGFRSVEPIQGRGKPASALLVEDRR